MTIRAYYFDNVNGATALSLLGLKLAGVNWPLWGSALTAVYMALLIIEKCIRMVRNWRK